MNLIPKICELLGVEIGEEFKLAWSGVEQTGLFRFTNYRLEAKYQDKDTWVECSVLTELVNGGITIIKLPFEPKNGDKYWYVYWNAKDPVDTTYTHWDGAVSNWADKYCGNCFRTEAEAECEKYNIYEKLTGKKWVVAE